MRQTRKQTIKLFQAREKVLAGIAIAAAIVASALFYRMYFYRESVRSAALHFNECVLRLDSDCVLGYITKEEVEKSSISSEGLRRFFQTFVKARLDHATPSGQPLVELINNDADASLVQKVTWQDQTFGHISAWVRDTDDGPKAYDCLSTLIKGLVLNQSETEVLQGVEKYRRYSDGVKRSLPGLTNSGVAGCWVADPDKRFYTWQEYSDRFTNKLAAASQVKRGQ